MKPKWWETPKFLASLGAAIAHTLKQSGDSQVPGNIVGTIEQHMAAGKLPFLPGYEPTPKLLKLLRTLAQFGPLTPAEQALLTVSLGMVLKRHWPQRFVYSQYSSHLTLRHGSAWRN